MGLAHIVLAVDESQTSREAARTALAWAARTGARLTVFTVLGVGAERATAATGPVPDGGLEAERVQRWLQAELERAPGTPPLRVTTATGLPGIEIPRFAETERADLLILGRKHRSEAARRLVGDTADAVARRSRVACLFVPRATAVPDRILVAFDGTARGHVVIQGARAIGTTLGAAIDVLIVAPLPEPAAEPRGGPNRATEFGPWAEAGVSAVRVRRGRIVEAILQDVEESEAVVLAIGYHRGGPPGVIEGASVARQLAHRAPCAVLTIPL